MACVEPDGTLSTVAREVLEALADGLDAPAIAARLGRPLFRVRASLRELTEAGLVTATADGHALTDDGRARLG